MASKSAQSGINKVGNSHYQTIVVDEGNGNFSSTLYRTDEYGKNPVPIGGSAAGADGTTAYAVNSENATPEEKKLLNDPNSQLRQTQRNQVKSTEKDFFGPDGGTKAQQDALNKATGSSASTNKGEPTAAEQEAALQKELGSAKARQKYPTNLKYPADLQIDYQDVIQFSVLKYEARKLNESGNEGLGSFGERSNYTSRTIGTVFLPIQGGISDANAVTWGSDSLTAIEKSFADIANAFIEKGGDAAANVTGDKLEGSAANSGEIKSALSAYFTGAAIGKSNILARTKGAIQNTNMELLFSGPTLRPFTFNFKLSARGTDDREQIRQIIRLFKQAMSVQRTPSQLFLKAPNTFKIRYLHGKDKDNPYMNRIKECALQSFTVNYTPEQTYMAFADGLMTSYEIQMTFQELEPIFNDDYTTLDTDKDTVIGY